MTNHTTTAGVQPAETCAWEVLELGSTYETVDSYETSTGHYVTVRSTHYETCSHVHIQVSNDSGYYNACNVHFSGFNHENTSACFVKTYLQGSDLQGICKYFDELYIEYEDEDEETEVE